MNKDRLDRFIELDKKLALLNNTELNENSDVEEWKKLKEELVPYNFRQVVHSLMLKSGINAFNILDETVGVKVGTTAKLYEKGIIDESDYIKMCNHFSLDSDACNWKYNYVCCTQEETQTKKRNSCSFVYDNSYKFGFKKAVKQIKERFKLEEIFKNKEKLELANNDIDIIIRGKFITVIILDDTNYQLIKDVKNFFYKELKKPLLHTIIEKSKTQYKKAVNLAGNIAIWIMIIIMVFGGRLTIDSNLLRWLGKLLGLDV